MCASAHLEDTGKICHVLVSQIQGPGTRRASEFLSPVHTQRKPWAGRPPTETQVSVIVIQETFLSLFVLLIRFCSPDPIILLSFFFLLPRDSTQEARDCEPGETQHPVLVLPLTLRVSSEQTTEAPRVPVSRVKMGVLHQVISKTLSFLVFQDPMILKMEEDSHAFCSTSRTSGLNPRIFLLWLPERLQTQKLD